MPTPTQLRTVRDHLLTLHKALLDSERAKYEKAYGPVRSPGEMLQLVLGNEHFAWLRPYSGLIVRIDEWLAADDAVTGGGGGVLERGERADDASGRCG